MHETRAARKARGGQRSAHTQPEAVRVPWCAQTITRAPVIDLQWLDKDDQNVLAITKKVGLDAGGLWLSTDGGKRWQEQTAQLNGALVGTPWESAMAWCRAGA